jgi:ankyrin repeat protein
MYGPPEALKFAIQADADVNSLAFDMSPLVATVLEEHDPEKFHEKLTILLEAGANVNHADEDGYTALHHCCTNGLLEPCKLLLDYGADTEAVNRKGLRAVDIADNNDDLVRLFMEAESKQCVPILK